jgi:hypothetical protein
MAPQQIIYRLPQCQQIWRRQPIPAKATFKRSGRTYAGYFEYGFRVREQLLPYKVVLFRNKKVFNIGAGFFLNQMVPQLLMLLEI